MESHPIPQNVTDFEFHLIGDMTIKQFGYLGAGLGAGYLIWVLLASKSILPFFSWPLIVVLVIAGIAFAFLPINERPLDHWLKAYLKAVFEPTKFAWKSGILGGDPATFQSRLDIYLQAMEGAAQAPVKQPRFGSISQYAPKTQGVVTPPLILKPQPLPQQSSQQPIPKPTQAEQPQPQPQPQPQAQLQPQSPAPQPAPVMPSSEELKKSVETAQQAQIIQTKIVNTQKRLEEIKAKAAQPGQDPEQFKEEFRKILGDLQILNKQASDISMELAMAFNVPVSKEKISMVQAQKPAFGQTKVVLTSTPNVVNGVVTDSTGNYVDGVIVLVHDKEGLPVRALKTNKLGQFIAVTPLPNGKYNLILEKDNLEFDPISVDLTGQVLPPIVLAAKKAVGEEA